MVGGCRGGDFKKLCLCAKAAASGIIAGSGLVGPRLAMAWVVMLCRLFGGMVDSVEVP
jgi:hypothetical protein